jgi:hypothetical protein
MRPPRPLRGVSRGVVRRDGVRRLRASSQRGTRAALELPPGPLGVPARSWLTARSAQFAARRTGRKQGPVPENAVIGAPRGACVPQGTSHKDFALFGAPSPLILSRAEGPVSKDRGKFPQNRTPEASRQGAGMPNPAVKRACHMEKYSCLNAGTAPQTRQYCRTACRKCGAIQQGSLSGTVRASRHPAVSASISV